MIAMGAARSVSRGPARVANSRKWAGRFNPLTLFMRGEQGVIYDPNDLSTLFQDSAGTTPVTAAGQPVGLMLDKRLGLVRGSEIVVNGTFDIDATGWAAHNTGSTSISAVGGVGVVTRTGGTTGGVVQTLNLTVGHWYTLSARARRTAGTGSISLNIINFSEDSFVLNNSVEGAITSGTFVSKSYLFRATETNNKIYFRSTTGSTNFEIDDVSVREIPGNHAFIATAASRPMLRQSPTLGAERLVNGSFASGSTGWILPANTAVTAGQLVFSVVDATTSARLATQQLALEVGKSYAVSVDVTAAGGVGVVGVSGGSFSAVPSGSRLRTTPGKLEFTGVASATSFYLTVQNNDSATFDNVSVREITGYYTDRNYLETDGSDDWMSTSAIDFTGTDKVSVFAGVRKLSDAAVGTFFEFGPNVATTNGSFSLFAPISVGVNTVTFSSRGSVTQSAGIPSVPAPINLVLSGDYSISGDSIRARANGGSYANNTADQGTGNYGNYPLYLFRRGGTSLPFSGHFYGLTIVGRLCTEAETRNVERLYANKTGVVLS